MWRRLLRGTWATLPRVERGLLHLDPQNFARFGAQQHRAPREFLLCLRLAVPLAGIRFALHAVCLVCSEAL